MTPKGLEGTVVAGRYEILSLLGRGTYATVWRARQTEGTGEVAIKILSPGYASDERVADDFLAQAKSYVAFRDDPHIATILDCGRDLDTGHIFVATTLLQDTVETLLARGGPLPPERIFRLAEDAGKALRTLHNAGLVHGDVKDTNLMTDPEADRFVLTDFSVGLVESADGTAPTMDMSRAGSWAYASPERINSTSRTDLPPASDFYSLGVVLFRVATGRFPFESSFPHVVSDHLKTPPPDPRSIRPEIPAGLAQLILRCLAKTPSQRFLDAGDFLRAVAAARDPEPEVRRGGFPRNRAIAIGGAAVGIVLLLLAFLLWPRGTELRLESSPDGASFRLYQGEARSRFDALEIGETPARLRGLESGEYTVVLERDGYFSKTQTIDVSGESQDPIVIVLSEMHRLQVESEPPGADATLRPLTGDRSRLPGGPTPSEFEGLRSGPHELVLRLESYATLVETVLVGKETGVIRRSLESGEMVALAVFSNPPGCVVYIDGRKQEDPTPCRIPSLREGTYEVAFEKDGFATLDTTFTLAAESPAETLSVELTQEVGSPVLDGAATPLFRDAQEKAEARAEDRVAALRDQVANHVRRNEWREADQALRALTAKVDGDAQIDTWKRQIRDGLTELDRDRAAQEELARKGVRETLRRYERALEARDVDAFSRLWVSLQPADRDKFEAALRDIREQKIEITEGSILVTGTRAKIDFREIREVRPTAGDPIKADRNRTMELRRMGSGEWLIATLR